MHLQNMVDNRPDIILQLGQHAYQVNDGDIEHENSCIERDCKESKINNFQELRQISVNVAKKRKDIKAQKELLEV
jgi:hypothetical protein